jgi:methylmalonyl-CoA mutase N-terminal domain/subunit
LRARRDNGAVERELARLSQAAENDRENLLPYLVDCAHAYVTVGEMVERLKGCWGNFQEPVGL